MEIRSQGSRISSVFGDQTHLENLPIQHQASQYDYKHPKGFFELAGRDFSGKIEANKDADYREENHGAEEFPIDGFGAVNHISSKADG